MIDKVKMMNDLERTERAAEKVEKLNPGYDINDLPSNLEELKAIVCWQNKMILSYKELIRAIKEELNDINRELKKNHTR